MKKKIIALALMLMLIAGVVNAASINGDYKGNPIVKVTSNGKLLETDEVPAQIYDGHTVVPISLLRQLGASVTWNQDSYTVDVKLPGTQSTTNKNNIPQIANDFKSSGYRFVQLTSDGNEYLISFVGTKPLSEHLADNDTFLKVLRKGIDTDAAYIGIEGSDRYRFSVKAAATSDYFSGKITLQALREQFLVDGKPLSASNGNQQIQPENNNISYTLNDAALELGFTGITNMTVDARSLAIELVEIRKTKKQSDYSVQDALIDLGIPQGSRATLATLRQAVKLISTH